MKKHQIELRLTEDDRMGLSALVKAPTTEQRLARRARMVLLCDEGLSDREVARREGVQRHTVRLWRERFAVSGMGGLHDEPGRGRKPSLAAENLSKVITDVAQPPAGRSRWSCRSMAQASGVSKSSVQRIWQANQLRPHRLRTFKLSNDPQFEEKFWDVIGLYLSPPDKALVLCCDEKTGCQALERTQLGLPLGVGHICTRTHDYRRHGTITLFAALDYLEGKIFSRLEKRHTHQEWLRFLKQIERESPKDVALHLIVDNYGTHRHAKVKAWLEKRPRFHLHFIPTSSSWMNLVEAFFSEITRDVIREGSFSSLNQLVRAIETYLAEHNLNPKRYVWKADGETILRKIAAARAALGAV